MRFRPTVVHVNLSHLQANWRALRGNAAPLAVAMVKANAYGHGAVPVAQSLADVGCERFGVALIEEGLELRSAGITQDIWVFASFGSDGADHANGEAFAACRRHRLEPVLGVESWVRTWLQTGSGPWHLEVDVGMYRMGLPLAAALELLGNLSPSQRPASVLAHLSHGEDAGTPSGVTQNQIQHSQTVWQWAQSQGIPTSLYASNSLLESHHPDSSLSSTEGVRPGLSLYGVYPDVRRASDVELLPVLSWTTQIARIHDVGRGQTVSYSGRWTATRDSRVAVLPVGYADGYSREWTGKGQVLVHGKRRPVIGTVCMDYIMVDVTGEPQAKPGDPVVLLGAQGSESLRVEEVARWSSTAPYTVLTGISARVPREYIHG